MTVTVMDWWTWCPCSIWGTQAPLCHTVPLTLPPALATTKGQLSATVPLQRPLVSWCSEVHYRWVRVQLSSPMSPTCDDIHHIITHFALTSVGNYTFTHLVVWLVKVGQDKRNIRTNDFTGSYKTAHILCAIMDPAASSYLWLIYKKKLSLIHLEEF